MTAPRSRRHSVVAAAALAAVGLVTAGCASHGGNGAGAASGAAGGRVMSEARPAAPHAAQAFDSGQGQDVSAQVQKRAVITTGHLVLVANDVSAARSRVDAVLAGDGGHIADENTTTDKKGSVNRTHLVVRVPSAEFSQAMRALAGVATLHSSVRQAADVTTQVIDVNARIAAERAGVRRLRDLVSRTANLSALLAVERALTVRQGALESLRQQQAYLADQTSEATITVDISRRTTTPPPAEHRGGFVGGLQHGWSAFTATVNGVLVTVGALLPFAILLALLGVPTWLVVRRLRRTREEEPPAESPAES